MVWPEGSWVGFKALNSPLKKCQYRVIRYNQGRHENFSLWTEELLRIGLNSAPNLADRPNSHHHGIAEYILPCSKGVTESCLLTFFHHYAAILQSFGMGYFRNYHRCGRGNKIRGNGNNRRTHVTLSIIATSLTSERTGGVPLRQLPQLG